MAIFIDEESAKKRKKSLARSGFPCVGVIFPKGATKEPEPGTD